MKREVVVKEARKRCLSPSKKAARNPDDDDNDLLIRPGWSGTEYKISKEVKIPLSLSPLFLFFLLSVKVVFVP